MGVTKIRQNLNVAGSATATSFKIGADTQIVRTAADKVGLASGDSLDLMTNGNNLQLPGGTAAIGTAAMGVLQQRLRIGSQGGTACLAFSLFGTTYFLLPSGNL